MELVEQSAGTLVKYIAEQRHRVASRQCSDGRYVVRAVLAAGARLSHERLQW